MVNEEIIAGQALLGETLTPARVAIVVRDGIIRAIEDEPRAPDHWIIPALFNSHTHIGDTVAMDMPVQGDLASLVTPPDGLKHRILAAAPRDRLIGGMKATIRLMETTGTAGFADFREGGPGGVADLRAAAQGERCRPCIFGRDGGEMDADGIGISSVRDISDAPLQADAARRAGKRVAVHAGERDTGDLDGALALDPDLLIHCTYAGKAHLRECADRQIPIVVCPRSNWRLGLTCDHAHPPMNEMLASGCTILLGTDNTMFVQPDLFREMAFLSAVYRLPPAVILRAAIAGSSLLKQPFWIEKGLPARVIVIDPLTSNLRFTHNIVESVVNRVSEGAIVKKVF